MFSIDRKIFAMLIGRKSHQKLIAMFLTLKFHADKGGLIKNATYNHIYKLTGIAPKTLRKYLPALVKFRYVRFAGKDNRHLAIGSLRNKHVKKNIEINYIKRGKFSDVYRQLRAIVFAFCQSRKDFIKRLLLALHNPKSHKEFKQLKQLVGKFVRKGIIPCKAHEYREHGFSYNGIAVATDTSARTAQRTVKDAIKMGLVTKLTHRTVYHFPNINYYPLSWATYTTRHCAVVVEANTYKLSEKTYNWFQINNIGLLS